MPQIPLRRSLCVLASVAIGTATMLLAADTAFARGGFHLHAGGSAHFQGGGGIHPVTPPTPHPVPNPPKPLPPAPQPAHPWVPGAVAVGAAAAVAADSLVDHDTLVYALPDDCVPAVVNEIRYENCNGAWYRLVYHGSQLAYIPVDDPN